jgi:hypothetical protein
MGAGVRIARASLPLYGAVLSAFLLASPAAAQTHRLKLQPLKPGAAESVRLFHPHVSDRLRATPYKARAARNAQSSSSTTSFRTQDGTTIPVAVSSAYTPDPNVEQGYVNFLGGLIHGAELGKISVYIATPSQIENAFCGAGALACYVGDEERMYVPGSGQQQSDDGNPPVQFLIAHEYGHHIELNRSNAPWSAYDQGTKRWATYENVCALERRHKVRTNYYNDPSEAFAESYADMQFPGVDFIYTDLLAPDHGAFHEIRGDVLHPWTGPRSRTLRGSFTSSGGKSVKSFRLRTPLDGTMTLALAPPAGASYHVRVLADSKRMRRRKLHSSAAGYTICGARTVTVQVVRRYGSGPFTIAATLP